LDLKAEVNNCQNFTYYAIISNSQFRASRDSLAVTLSGNRKEVGMNTLEVLTLLLVVFAALTYIDNRNNRK